MLLELIRMVLVITLSCVDALMAIIKIKIKVEEVKVEKLAFKYP